MKKRRKLNPRKVLIASVGLATLDYTGCSGKVEDTGQVMDGGSGAASGAGGNPNVGGSTVANLVGPPVGGGGVTVANLIAPPPGGTGGVTVANLVAPPPPDAGPADASADGPTDGSVVKFDGSTVANLVAPPPDASND